MPSTVRAGIVRVTRRQQRLHGRHRARQACINASSFEEKVLALQAQKRDLADTIVTADNAMLTRIGGDELDLLLS